MSTVVEIYDGFYTLDPANDWWGLGLMLVASSYTFDHTHTSVATSLISDEASGSGYARISGLNIARSGSTPPAVDLILSASGSTPAFAPLTTTDYRYAVVIKDDKPVLCIDAGALQTLTDQGLTISGTLLTITGP